MLKKALRWIVITLGVLTLLLLIGGMSLCYYVQTNQHRAVQEAAQQMGFELSYRKATLTAWSTWPRLSLKVDSLTLRDTSQNINSRPLLQAEQLDLFLSFNQIWDDKLRIESFALSEGAIHLLADTSGSLNLGALAGARERMKSKGGQTGLFNPVIDWENVRIGLTCFKASFVDSLKNQRFATYFDSLSTTARTLPNGDLQFHASLNTHVEGLGFNLDNGSYLKNTALSGDLTITRRDSAWIIDPTTLLVGPDEFGVAATFGRGEHVGMQLSIDNPAVDYDRARILLHAALAKKLAAYHVDGPFSISADVISRPEYANNVEVRIRFAAEDQAVRLNTFRFEQVTSSGLFVNRLPQSEGGTGSLQDFRIITNPTVAYYDGMRIESAEAIVRGKNNEPFLDAPIKLTGKANALARLFGNTNFIFTDGNFRIDTHVDASLMAVEDIISSSNGQLILQDLDVDYEPAAVRFTFGSIELNKEGKDVGFRLSSGDFPTGIEFKMEGYISNILPLLLDRPADSLVTKVKLTADRLDWSGFRSLFGEEEYADGNFDPEASANTDAQIQSMKRTLLGLKSTFNPHLEVEVGELAYYDVMSLTDFATGLYFDGDTMVLRRTSFDWSGSDLAFDARLDMSAFNQTPFEVNVAADHLNLHKLRKPLGSFGLKLPGGIDSLPTDLLIRFGHRGIINDTFGIIPGHNIGTLAFSDGRQGRFAGNVHYEPVDGVLNTLLDLEGDPVFVNELFAAENFFFGTGHFRIDVKMTGVPEDLGELVANSSLRLQIDSTRVKYLPAGAYIPIQNFLVTASENQAAVDLQLTSDATRRSVILRGKMDNLSAFLYPERGESFRIKADASARRLHVSDLKDFIRFEEKPTAVPILEQGPMNSSPPFDPQQILSASEGMFKSFRPDLSLQIDTFDVDASTQFTDLHTGFRLRDSSLLILEKSGFTLNAGRVELSGTYDLDRRLKSPFTLEWQTDSVRLDKLLLTLTELGLPGTDSLGTIRGILATSGDVDGRIDEKRRILLLNQSQAGVNLKLSPTQITNWPGMEELGRKLLMKKRFRSIAIAPMELALTVDSGTIYIPRVELQTTALQLFVEGKFDTIQGLDLLIALPVSSNLWRGVQATVPTKTGFAKAGWKVYLVIEQGKDGGTKTRFRLGRRKYYKDRGRLAELRSLKQAEKAARKARQ